MKLHLSAAVCRCETISVTARDTRALRLDSRRHSSRRKWWSKKFARTLGFEVVAIGIIAFAPIVFAGQGPDMALRNRDDFLSRILKIAMYNDLTNVKFVSDTLGVTFKGNLMTSPDGLVYYPLYSPPYLSPDTHIIYSIPNGGSDSKFFATLIFDSLTSSLCIRMNEFDNLLPNSPRRQEFISRTFSYDVRKQPDISNILLVNAKTDDSCIYYVEILANR